MTDLYKDPTQAGGFVAYGDYLKLEQENAELKRIIAESQKQEPEGYKFIVWDGRRRNEVLAIDYIPQFHKVFGMEEIRGKFPLFASPIIQESITSKMVLAGCAELPEYQNTIGAAILVKAIYKAMLNAAKEVRNAPNSRRRLDRK